MGQVPAKYFPPSAPYGSSPAANVLNPSQPAAANPQTPLLPPNFQDPGTMQSNLAQSTGIPSMAGSGGGNNNDLFGGRSRMFGRGLFGLIAILFLSASSWATTTVTGTLKNLGTGTVSGGAFVRFWLRGCQGVQPRVNGTAVIAPTQGGVYYQDFVADVNGNISGTVYSTRDATGNLNGEIECPSSVFTATWYGVQLFLAGKAGPETPVAAKNGATLNVTNVTPLSASPVVTAPTGDTVYLRLDGGNSPVTGPVAFNSSLNVSGTTTLCNLNGMLILNPTCFAGADIGAQINTAYAALPSTGGVIGIPCQVTGAVYNFSTPVVMTVGSKFASIVGLCPGNQIGTGGMVLNYTPTTATAAITIDYQNSTGSATENLALSNFTLFNNNCVTAGGCGSSATGVSIGSTNGGCGKCVFERVNIKGFGTGVNNPTNVSWGQTYRNDIFDFNTTGLNYANGENTKIEDSQFELNGTGITSATGEITMNGGSLDSNTVVGFTCTGAVGVQASFFTDVHFENLGQSNTHFISGTCNVNIKGGSASNDNVGGTSDWMFSASGGLFTVDHLQVNSTQTLTVGYFQCTSPARCDLIYTVGTPTAANPLVGGTAASNAYVKAVYVSTSNTPSLIQQGDTVQKPPFGIGDAAFTPSASSALNIRANSATYDFMRWDDTGSTPKVFLMGPGTGGCAGGGFGIRNASAALQMACFGYTSPFAVAFNQGVIDLTEVAMPGGNAGSHRFAADSATHTPSWNINNVGTSSPTGAWQCTNVTPVTVNANTTGDQNLMTCSVPGGTLNRVTRTLQGKLSGIYSTPAASTTAIVIKVKLGASTLATWTSTALPTVQAANNQWSIDFDFTVSTAGASSVFAPHGKMLIDLGAGNLVADTAFLDVNTGTVAGPDITATQTLQVTFATTVGQGAGFSSTQNQMILQTVN